MYCYKCLGQYNILVLFENHIREKVSSIKIIIIIIIILKIVIVIINAEKSLNKLLNKVCIV